MRESSTRQFLGLAYEKINILLLWGIIRCLPWLIPILLFTFLPHARFSTENYALILGSVCLLSILIEPALSGAAYHLADNLVRRDSPDRSIFTGFGRYYLPLLAGAILQLFLAVFIIHNIYLMLGPQKVAFHFVDLFALGSCSWLLLMLRIWHFYFLPLLFRQESPLGDTARLTVILLLEKPGRTIRHFALRQLIGLLLILSGLGPFLALGSFLPLHACLSVRIALKPHLPEEEYDSDEESSSKPKSFKQLLRPWE
ncbi:MAG: hypothetical protein GY835_00385 [bacterium]|nr:hypothetical protein [bacterium]